MEAAMVLPLFLAFTLAMISMVMLTMTETALDSAVTQTAEQIAAYLYPAQILFTQIEQSKTVQSVEKIIQAIRDARSKLISGEQTAQQYEQWIPEPVLEVLESEINIRTNAETIITQAVQEQLNKLLTKIVALYMNPYVLSPKHLKVVDVVLPNLISKQQMYVKITAEYVVKLPLPFIHKEIRITKTALQRAWLGAY